MFLNVESLERRDTPSGFSGDLSAAVAAGADAIQHNKEMQAMVAPLMQDMAEMRAKLAPVVDPTKPMFTPEMRAMIFVRELPPPEIVNGTAPFIPPQFHPNDPSFHVVGEPVVLRPVVSQFQPSGADLAAVLLSIERDKH